MCPLLGDELLSFVVANVWKCALPTAAKVETFEQDPSSLNYKDTEWETYSMVIGWPVQGIWPAYSDVTDVNAADRNFGGNEVVTGEDSGLVKLFRFPCLGESSRGKLTKRVS